MRIYFFVWKHKILSIIAELMDKDPVLEGTVYLDEKLVDVNPIGTKKSDQEKPKKRGISDQKRNIACAIDEKGNTVIQVSEKGKIHADVLITIFKEHIPSREKEQHRIIMNLKCQLKYKDFEHEFKFSKI